MANPEHLRWLLEDVECWNARRKREDFQPNLEGVDVREEFRKKGRIKFGTDLVPLAGIDFSKARLKGANLYHADLADADFAYADIRRVDLSWSILKDANLIGANLEETKLFSSDLRNTNWSNTKPWKAILHRPLDEFEQHAQVLIPTSDLASSVSSVGAAIQECKRLYQHYRNRPTDEPVLYFRGESNSTWELRPPVIRSRDQGVRLSDREGQMLIDLMSRQPEAFDTHDSALSQWVLAQHHGLKTRLIDINRNLAVALFFACGGFEREHGNRENDNKDGRLNIFAVPRTIIKPFSSDTISVIANFGKLSFVEQETLLGANLGFHTLDFHRSLRRLYHFIRQEKPSFDERINPIDFFGVFIVEPQRRFDRIRTQAGAFLISAFHERFERCEVVKQNPGIPIYDHYALIIPHTEKENILEELRMLDITYETLFPGLDETAGAVTQAHLDASLKVKTRRHRAG